LGGRGMFPGQSKPNHIVGFIKEPIKLSVAKKGQYVVKTDCTITRGKFWISQKVTFSVTLFLSPKRLSGVEKGYVTRKLPKLCRFCVILLNLYFLSEV